MSPRAVRAIADSGARGSLVRGEEHPHAIADLVPGDAVADGVDDAGTVLVRHHLGEWGRPTGPSAGSRLPIGRVHGRHDDPHADLAGRGFGNVPVDDAEDGGRAGLGVRDRSHAGANAKTAVDLPFRVLPDRPARC